MNKIKTIRENAVFIPFVLLLLIMMAVFPSKIKFYYRYVDWKTILNLTGLMIITFGIKESLFLSAAVNKILEKIKVENILALLIVSISVLLSMFLTNDIALFIMIPLTLTFLKLLKNDLKRIIVFQAIGVNVGSALTPIGNPQNIFLWHKWNVSFWGFVVRMFPMFLIQFLLLIVFLFLTFPHKRLSSVSVKANYRKNEKLFFLSLLLLILFVVSIELGFSIYGLGIVLIFYIIFYQKVLKKTDWGLILLFIIMFIDFYLIGVIPIVSKFMSNLNFDKGGNVFLSGIALSQIMSNVPAAIFMSRFSSSWRAIAFGTNIGGNGVVVASLANIIAVRLSKNKNGWRDFHKYSIVFMIVAMSVVYLIYYM